MDFRISALLLVKRMGLERTLHLNRGTSESALEDLGLGFRSSIALVLAARQANHEEGTKHRDHSLEARAPRHGDQE